MEHIGSYIVENLMGLIAFVIKNSAILSFQIAHIVATILMSFTALCKWDLYDYCLDDQIDLLHMGFHPSRVSFIEVYKFFWRNYGVPIGDRLFLVVANKAHTPTVPATFFSQGYLVWMAFFWTSHMKTYIFWGTFVFQICFCAGISFHLN